MSEASDDAPSLEAKDGSVPPAGDPPAAVESPEVDADDVEVTPSEEPPPPRYDSVHPTSRKLAPPPKPKRDSAHPSSRPPPPAFDIPALGSLNAPSTPAISFQDASSSSRDVVAAALASTDSLRSIGEALAKDAGAFSANETPTGGRPPVPRPRSSPAINAVAGDASPLSGVPETRPSEELVAARRPSSPPRDKQP